MKKNESSLCLLCAISTCGCWCYLLSLGFWEDKILGVYQLEIREAEPLRILQNEFIIGIRINMMGEAKKLMVQKGKLENESWLTNQPCWNLGE